MVKKLLNFLSNFFTESKKEPEPSQPAPPPTFVTRICRVSEKLASEYCPIADIDYRKFIVGTEPQSTCDYHKKKVQAVAIVTDTPVTITKYPVTKCNKLLAYVPADLWGEVLPWRGPSFNRKSYRDMVELMAKHNVNGTRSFFSCTEGLWSWTNNLMPFMWVKRDTASNKFMVDLLKWNMPDLREYESRLNEYWKREMTTVIVAGYMSRWDDAVWNGKHNVNGTTSRSKFNFFVDSKSIKVYDKVLTKLCKRYADNPYVIIEFVNEPPTISPGVLANWYKGRLDVALRYIPEDRLAINYFNSSKIFEVMDGRQDIWVFVHGVNNLSWFKRFHRKGCEMQKCFFEVYPHVCADTDGWIPSHIGEGFKGHSWFPGFRRPASDHMAKGFKYTIRHKGAGWVIMSAGAYVDDPTGHKPDLRRLKEIAIDGLKPEECGKYGVTYELNKRGELKAIKSASNILEGYI